MSKASKARRAARRLEEARKTAGSFSASVPSFKLVSVPNRGKVWVRVDR